MTSLGALRKRQRLEVKGFRLVVLFCSVLFWRCLALGYSHAAMEVVIPMPVVRFTSGTTAAAALQSALAAGDSFTTGAGSAVFLVMLAGSI